MQYRPLGSSGLQVSPICLGTMSFGNPISERDAIRLTHGAIDLGINFIDTANVYEGYNRVFGSAGGLSEQILGKAVCDRRDRVVLATKVAAPIGPGPQDRGATATHIVRELDRCLTRLQTDTIDLFVIHWPDKATPLETTLGAMDLAVRQGKVRCFGTSNHSAAQLCELLWTADKRHWTRVVSSQVPYSMLQREFHNDLEFCVRHRIGVTPWRSLQGGLLTGKYRRGQAPPPGSRYAETSDMKTPGMWGGDTSTANFDQLEAIEKLAEEAGVPMASYVLAWTLAQPAMASLIVGAKRIEQVEQAIASLDVKIPEDHYARIDRICPPPWRQDDPIRS